MTSMTCRYHRRDGAENIDDSVLFAEAHDTRVVRVFRPSGCLLHGRIPVMIFRASRWAHGIRNLWRCGDALSELTILIDGGEVSATLEPSPGCFLTTF